MAKEKPIKTQPSRRPDIAFWFDMRTGKYIASVVNRLGLDELLKASMYLYALALDLNKDLTIAEVKDG